MGVDPSAGNWYARVFYDLSYFVIITTVLMNVVFGIILDQFGSLRDETSDRENYMKNTTFISCLERSEVEKAANFLNDNDIRNGFTHLEEQKQNKWNYLNYIFYLQAKDENDYSGPESYTKDLLDQVDIQWLPIGRCRLIERVERLKGA